MTAAIADSAGEDERDGAAVSHRPADDRLLRALCGQEQPEHDVRGKPHPTCEAEDHEGEPNSQGAHADDVSESAGDTRH